MKVVEKEMATATVVSYAADVRNGPVVVTDCGKPVAVLVPLENVDLEALALSTNHQFIALIERSRARVRAEGGIPRDEIRHRFR